MKRDGCCIAFLFHLLIEELGISDCLKLNHVLSLLTCHSVVFVSHFVFFNLLV